MNFNHIGRTSLLLFLLPFFINATDNLKEDGNGQQKFMLG